MSSPGGYDGPGVPGPVPNWSVHSPYGPPAGPVPEPVAPRRRRAWLAVVASLVVLAMLLATGAAIFATIDTDEDPSRSPVARLLDRVEQSESVMRLFQSGMADASSRTDLTQIANGAQERLSRERGRVADLNLGDQGSTLDRARADYLDHVDAWLTAMTSVAEGSGIENGPQIDRTFRDACGALRNAARVEGGNRDLARIARICAAPEPSPGSDGDSGTLRV